MRRRVERLSRGVTHGVDKWQALHHMGQHRTRLIGTLSFFVIPSSQSRHLLHTANRSEFADELFQSRRVVYIHGEVSAEQSVVTVNIDAAHHDFLFF